jgi:hypothetical protein
MASGTLENEAHELEYRRRCEMAEKRAALGIGLVNI